MMVRCRARDAVKLAHGILSLAIANVDETTVAAPPG